MIDMKGRKRIPSKIIDLMGGTKHTKEKPRLNEPKPPEKMPTCPGHLCNEAKKEWRRAGKILSDIGLMTELDRSTLAEHCESYGRWIALKKELKVMQKIDSDQNYILKNMTRRCEQYKSECKRWNQAVVMNETKGIVGKNKKNGLPIFSPYLIIEREAASIMMNIEKSIKKEIREAEDAMIKTGVLLGMSPSSRASLKVEKDNKPDKVKEFMKRK